MSMSSPFEPHLGQPDDGEEPDRPEEQPPADAGGRHADPPDDPPFRTPDPHELQGRPDQLA